MFSLDMEIGAKLGNAPRPRHPAVYTMPSPFQPVQALRRQALYINAVPACIHSIIPNINGAT